jgi:hypothetical protein
MKFKYGMMVKYRGTYGWVNFINDDYFTLCYIDIPDHSCHIGCYQANLIVYREHWNEVCCCVDETKEKQKD